VNDRVTSAITALSNAFRGRDLDAALACFADDLDATYVGSEQGELAIGPDELRELLARVFARDEAYSWTTNSVWAWERGELWMVVARLAGTVHRDAGGTEHFPYVLSGVVRVENDQGRWLLCHGAEPTT
jgi:ketosteroid isomerase-like protein